MSQYYVAIDDELVAPRTRYMAHSVAGHLTAILDLPKPAIVFLQASPSSERRGDVHIEERELDIDVPAGIVSRAPNTIWLAPAPEAQVVRSVAHEIGHIAELLGFVAERGDVEEFPRLLANAVSTTYAAGIGWIDRLLSSHFYFHALAEGGPIAGVMKTWSRGDYWARLERTRGGFGFVGTEMTRPDGSRVTASGEALASPLSWPHPIPESRRPLLFPVLNTSDDDER